MVRLVAINTLFVLFVVVPWLGYCFGEEQAAQQRRRLESG